MNDPASDDTGQLYRQMIDASPASTMIVDARRPDLPIIDVNPAFEAMTGYRRDEVIGRNARFLQGSDRDQAELEKIRAGLRDQVACTALLRNYRKDGSLYWNELQISPIRDANGAVTHFIGVQNNITRYKQAEEGLRQSQERLTAMIEIIPDIVFRHSPDGRFLDYHAPSEDMLAVPPEVFLGKKIEDIFSDNWQKFFVDIFSRVMQSRQMERVEYEMETPAGMQDFEARFIPSGVDEITTIIRDVTTLRQAERQSISLTLEKERTRLLTEFVRNASHEFRTPLSIISSSAYLMARSDDSEKRKLREEQIQANVVRTTKLVDLLLKIVTLETSLPDRAPVDVSALLHTLQNKVLLPVEAARIRFDIQPDLPTIAGYGDHLTDAIRQVVENALRYTPETGQISVRTYTDATRVVIEVADSGAGISADALLHIFETFWRQDEAHSTPGLGLGLSIAQKIIALHDGHIDVESTVGQGSVFRIVLPR